MSFGRLKAWLRTLRFRLLLWNTAVVLLIVFPTLAGVREWLRYTQRHEFDEILKEDLLEVRLTLSQSYPDWERFFQAMNRKAQGHAHRHWFVQIVDAEGGPLWSSASTPGVSTLSRLSEPTRQAAEGNLRTFNDESDPYRLIEGGLELPNLPPLTVRVGSSLRDRDADVELLTRTMLLVAILILVLAPLGGYWLAGRATRPLAQIIDRTARLRPSNLDERLAVRGTGDELDRLSVTINGFLDRLAVYLEQRHDFIANAAHELRSPLTAIHSCAELALSGDRTPEEYQALLGDVAEECERLGRLVNQLLLLAEGDCGRLTLDLKPVRLDAVVRKAVTMFHGVAEAREVRLASSRLEPATVRGTEDHLRPLVQNLIDNAVKFTPAGGQVEVSLRADVAVRRAVLRVADTGVGIPANDLPRIFERFYRGDRSRSREKEAPGTGLGLSICQAVVTALGGTIRVESGPGQGSVFTVELPLADSEA
jgi:heavy metal sensor kinase